jgi:hypothetical protein
MTMGLVLAGLGVALALLCIITGIVSVSGQPVGPDARLAISGLGVAFLGTYLGGVVAILGVVTFFTAAIFSFYKCAKSDMSSRVTPVVNSNKATDRRASNHEEY